MASIFNVYSLRGGLIAGLFVRVFGRLLRILAYLPAANFNTLLHTYHNEKPKQITSNFGCYAVKEH